MRRTQFLMAMALTLAVAVVASSVQAEEADKEKSTKLVGKWTVTEVQKDGKKEDDVKGKTVTITKDTITCSKDKESEMECRYTLDTSSKPWQVTMNCTKGEHKGKKLAGIVELDGDTARICFSKPDEKAPTSTKETKEGQCCITLKRAE